MTPPSVAVGERERLESQAATIATLQRLIAKARHALQESRMAQDSHYAHFDRDGTAGANCPACKARLVANNYARECVQAIDSALAAEEPPHA